MFYAFGLIGAIFGGFMGLLLGLITAHFSIPKSVGFIRYLLLQLGAGLAGCILGIVVGVIIESAVIDAVLAKHKANQQQSLLDKVDAIIPLKVALCNHQNADEAKAILANPLDAKTQKELGYIALFCTQSAQAKELLPQMMALLHTQYLSGNGDGYCMVLNSHVDKQDIVRLRELQAQKLPLYCAGSAQQFRINSAMFKRVKPDDEERAVELIQLLNAAGVPLNTMRSAAGESILDEVINYAPPSIIKAFLAAGIDPGYPPGDPLQHRRTYPAAVLQWIVRKHQNCTECQVPPGWPLGTEQIADIDRVMREPTTEEINRQATVLPVGSILFKISDFKYNPDGGAAFFRYLKSRGADLGAAGESSTPQPSFEVTEETKAGFKRGFLGYSDRLSPALRAELEKLTPQEINLMAHPKIVGSNKFEEPLLVSARRNKNKSLEEFLCARQVNGCLQMASEKSPGRGKK